MKICSDCGLGHDNDAVRCRRCGGELTAAQVKRPGGTESLHDEKVRICPACGLGNREQAAVCRECGESLSEVPVVSSQALAEKATEKFIRRKYWYDAARKPMAAAAGVLCIPALVSLLFIPWKGVGMVLLCLGGAACAFLFPDLEFRLRTFWIARSAEPSDLYYLWNFIGGVLLLAVSLFILILGWIERFTG